MDLVKVVVDGVSAKVSYGGKSYPGVIGRGGLITDKREGDESTPIGKFRILEVMYRPDRVDMPEINFPARALEPDDVWVDDPSHPKYNQPAKASEIEPEVNHEKMWRDDHLYNVVVDLDYNRENPEPGKGSAIFMHVARDQANPTETPTEGCLALSQSDLLELLASLPKEAAVDIQPKE
jgi:L,D-peptidoglycan transpeptidase YkuD (ErfK/YbiS/YcfS/YnhG family)